MQKKQPMFSLQTPILVAITFGSIQNLNLQTTPACNKVKLTPGLILITLEKSLKVVPQCALRKTCGIMFYCRTAAATLRDLGAWVLVISVCIVVLFVGSLLFPVLVDVSC